MSAISDTGTSLALGPSDIIEKVIFSLSLSHIQRFQLAEIVGASADGNGDYLMPCKGSSAPINIKIGDHDYAIPRHNYVINYGDPNTCVFGFGTSIDHNPEWILGDTFIRSICNVYDVGNSRLGFAIPKVNGTRKEV